MYSMKAEMGVLLAHHSSSLFFDKRALFPLKYPLYVVYLALTPSVLQKSCVHQSSPCTYLVRDLRERLSSGIGQASNKSWVAGSHHACHVDAVSTPLRSPSRGILAQPFPIPQPLTDCQEGKKSRLSCLKMG